MSPKYIPVEPARLSTSQTVIETGTPDLPSSDFRSLPNVRLHPPSPPLLLETLRGVTCDDFVRDPQAEFWEKIFAFKQTLLHKLGEVGRFDLIGSMARCQQAEFALTCNDCQRVRVIKNRCERRWCPICAARLARERVEGLMFWVRTLKQPKHVVLTTRNTDRLTRDRVRLFQKSLFKLRKQRLATGMTCITCNVERRSHNWSYPWLAGTWAMEVTNESRGWHLHAHLLIESRFIDVFHLCHVWSKLQRDQVIIRVEDARATDYLREVAKYVVKSSQLASWPSQEIAEFMDAFNRVRTFGVFGSLVGQREQWKLAVRSARTERNKCECGCGSWSIEPRSFADFPTTDHLDSAVRQS